MCIYRAEKSHCHGNCIRYLITNLYFRKVKKGSLLIDSSTIDPTVSKELAKAVEKMGAVFMDAPVSGGKSSLTVYLIGCLVLLAILAAALRSCALVSTGCFSCCMYAFLFHYIKDDVVCFLCHGQIFTSVERV